MNKPTHSVLMAFLLSLPLLAAVTACQKDYAEPETVFRCDSASDHYVYCDIDLDGWTMVLDEGKIPIVHSKYSYQENLWNVYGEWADAHYHVSEKTLMVGADKNESGRERTAMIIASFNGRTKVFRIIQEK